MSKNNLYYFLEDGTYVEGYEGDNVYNEETCTLIKKKPSDGGYTWDSKLSDWKLSIDEQKKYIRSLRNPELSKTDKYMFEDYPITAEQRAELISYRQSLRDVTDKQTPQEITMPTPPDFLGTND